MLVVTAGDRAVTVRERAGIPNAGNNGRDPIGDRARSLTVTALSCGAYFMISWRMKLQVRKELEKDLEGELDLSGVEGRADRSEEGACEEWLRSWQEGSPD